MGSNRNDDRRSRRGNRNATAAPASSFATPETRFGHFDRDQDMGGSQWSGASGRGGMSDEGSAHEASAYAASNRGYGGERDYASERYDASERYSSGRVPAPARREDCGFIEERGFGHVPGQRWSGGYGGDRADASSGPPSGRGFTGSDFGTPDRIEHGDSERDRMRALGPRRDMRHRHFGTPVDRGGRMGPSEGFARASDRDLEDRARPDHGPHWGKGPKGYVRSDVRTYEDVCEAIAYEGQVDASDVDVKVDNSIVTLTGTVAGRHDKRALERLVERVRGVQEVHNELRLARNVYRDASAGLADERVSARDSQE